MENIGQKIRDLRTSLGMTQEELALKIGYKSRVSINKIELQRDVPIKKIVPIAEALGVDPSVLMGWEDSPKNMPEPKLEHFALIEKYEMLSNPQQKLIMDTIDSLLQMNNI